MLLALIPIAVFCLWPGRLIVHQLTRQHAFKQIQATNGTVFHGDRGFALKLERSQLLHLVALKDVGGLDLARSSLNDDDISRLRPLRNLMFLDLSENSISDSGLKSVENCEKLRVLFLQDTAITSHGLKHLKRMTKLENLLLDGTSIDDDGLRHLRNCNVLRELSLFDTNITAEGIKHLRGLSNLITVSVPKNWSPADVAQLKMERPNLTVFQQRAAIPR